MKLTTLSKSLLLAAASLPCLSSAASLTPIPNESGLNGFVIVGGNVTDFSSNIVAGNSLTHVDHDSTNSLSEAPSSEQGSSGFFTGELNYTFAKARTQIYVGNELADVLRYDLTTQVGVRHELKDKGIISAAYLTSGMLPTHVYEDPFNVNDTQKADRDMRGVKLGWDNINNTKINVELGYKKVDIDEEASGQALVETGKLTPEEQQLLHRSGNTKQLKVSYLHSFDTRHHIEPELTVAIVDKDGEAISNDRYGAGLSYFYKGERYSFVGQVAYSHSRYDANSPVWDLKDVGDNNTLGVSMVGTYEKPFDWESTSLVTSVAYGTENSNIDFYDADILTASVGLLYEF